MPETFVPLTPLTIPPIDIPTITPGAYVRIRREALGLSLEDLALMLMTVPGVSAHRRVQWLAMIESGAEEISVCVALALHDTIALDLRMLAYWMAIAEGAKPSLVDVLFAPTLNLAA